MKAPVLNLFNKKHSEASKSMGGEHSSLRSKATASTAPGHAVSDPILKAMPSWWVVLLAYALTAVFGWLAHKFFLWFPPYLHEVFLNLKGLPMAWADLGLFWAERGVVGIAVAAALYHNLWQVSTRYRLSSHDLAVESWFPVHRVVSAPYGSVRRIGFQQGLMGLVFNYGQIEIDTGSPAGPLTLLNCPNPRKFVDLLQPKVESVLQPGLSHSRRATDLHPQ